MGLFHLTDDGTNIYFAQQLYALLYLTSLGLSILLYWKAKAPNWTLVLLPLSKRLHSIFVLRLFNDCWATTIMQLAILAFCNGFDFMGSIAFSLALSVKMSILLYLPAVGIILLKRHGLVKSLVHVGLILTVQAGLASNYFSEFTIEYLNGSFDFSRQFLYKWTVNWKIFSEDVFLSSQLAYGLLACHATTLIFLGHYYWCRAEGGLVKIVMYAVKHPRSPVARSSVTTEDIVKWMFTANLIGITFARSLHYQFYSWYAYQLPYFAFKAQGPVVLKILCIICIEFAWNTFPATQSSSTMLLISNIFFLLTMLLSQAPDQMSTNTRVSKT